MLQNASLTSNCSNIQQLALDVGQPSNSTAAKVLNNIHGTMLLYKAGPYMIIDTPLYPTRILFYRTGYVQLFHFHDQSQMWYVQFCCVYNKHHCFPQKCVYASLFVYFTYAIYALFYSMHQLPRQR